MAINNWIHDCACEMLGVHELHLDIRNYLDEIETYTNLVGGSVHSRQIVAMALVNYMDRRAFLNKVEELEDNVRYEE